MLIVYNTNIVQFAKMSLYKCVINYIYFILVLERIQEEESKQYKLKNFE